VVQQVFSLRMRASALAVELEQDAQTRHDGIGHDRLRSIAGDLAELSKNALVDLRVLMFELRPGSLSGGLLDAIRAHAARLEQDTGLAISVEAGDEVPDLPADLEHDLYRVVQEALHNTVKHADAHTVEITLRLPDPHRDTLVLEVRDDGHGGRDHAEGGAHARLGVDAGTGATLGWWPGGRRHRCGRLAGPGDGRQPLPPVSGCRRVVSGAAQGAGGYALTLMLVDDPSRVTRANWRVPVTSKARYSDIFPQRWRFAESEFPSILASWRTDRTRRPPSPCPGQVRVAARRTGDL
jgi:hypothetical protein